MDARKARRGTGDTMHPSAGVVQLVERQPSKVTEGCAEGSAEWRGTRIVEPFSTDRSNRSELSEIASDGAGVARNVASVERSYSGRELDAIASAAFVERFRSKVGERDADGCRPWLGSIWSSAHVGYGCIKHAGKALGAHRVAFALEHGWLPPVVMHSCDRRDCVEPSHLVAGTHALNTADKVAKGRQARGTRNGAAKLTPEKIAEARRIRETTGASYRAIGAMFGVSHVSIRQAIVGVTWRVAA